jgi:signal transduction histidine kinase
VKRINRLATRLVLSHLLVIATAMALLSFVLLSLVEGYFTQAFQASLVTQARLTAQALTATAGGLAAAPANGAGVAPAAGVTATVPVLPSAQNALQQQQAGQISVQILNTSPYAPALDNSTIRLSAELDTRVRVLDAHGIVQADSAGSERGRDLSADPVVAAALRGEEMVRSEGDWVFVATPLRRDTRVVGVVYLGQPLRDVVAVLADLRTRLLVSAAVALVLSGAVGWVLARAIARPVRELTSAANHLAKGDFDYPLDVRGADELGELSRAFRSMGGDLRQMLQARTDLVGNVSHELRTPLTAIKGLVETLRDGAVDDLEKRDTFLASIEGETDRLIRLVNDLLLLSRADSQALVLHHERFDAGELARDCAAELAATAAARHVTIAVDASPVRVNADPDRIRQVLVNLLDNAVRYSPPEQRVSIGVATTADGVAITVHDNGPGIPAADQARVFQRFYRADRSRAREARGAAGAGLGLAIARALVEAHGGRITVVSDQGRGTTFRFVLPVC